MSNSNENNRPDVAVRLGAITAAGTRAVLYAHKTLLLRNAAMVFDGAVAGTPAANFSFTVRDRAGAETNDVSNEVPGVAGIGEALDLEVADEYVLEKGHTLQLVIAETGSAADISGATFVLDYQVKGN